MIGYFTPYKKAYRILFLIMFIATILQAFLPFISKAVIDTSIRTQDVNFVYMVLAANIVLILSITLSNVLRDWVEAIGNIQKIKINNYEDTKRYSYSITISN